MKVKAYKKDEVPESVLRLDLQQSGGSVILVAVREDGTPVSGGNLLTITPKGKLSLSFNVSTDLGLRLDKEGRLLV